MAALLMDMPVPIERAPALAQWCVVQTQSCREQAVALRLTRQGIDCYLPQERVRRIVRGKPETIDRPLYPTYLFASFADEYERHDIRRTQYVQDLLLTVHDAEQQRLSRQITSLAKALEIDPFVQAVELSEPGQRVKVIRGSFKNCEGEIIKRVRKVRDRVIVKDILRIGVLMLGRVVEYEVDPSFCEPL